MSKPHTKVPSFPTQTSLVRYDNPVLVSSSNLAEHAAHGNKSDPNLTATEDILNSILPPREWTADGQLWVQYVSCTPATRSDVIGLTQALDRELQSRRALETGICPIREELYAQCLDELIRQVTIQCFERGLLLLRIRDECRLTLAHYQLLYESSTAFGMRKSLSSDQSRAELTQQIASLESERRELERQTKDWKSKIEELESREATRRETEQRKHKEEVDQLKKHNAALKKELENILSIHPTDQ